jgi:AraC-like DNA-binding protein
MPSAVHEVPAIYAAHLVALAGHWGVEPGRLLAGLAVDVAALRQPGALVPYSTFGEIARRAMAFTDEPGLGVYFGMATRATWHGFLGFAALASANLGDVLTLVERFSAVRAPVLTWRQGHEGDESFIEVSTAALPAELREFMASWVLVSFAYTSAAMLDRPLSGHLDVSFPERPYHQHLLRYLPGPVRFGQPHDRLLFASDLLRLPLASADPAALQQATALCERELAERGLNGQLIAKLKARLPRAEGGFKGIDELAGELQMSSRTLRRQLEAAGTSYAEELERLRHDRALALVADKDRSFDAIARELGYTDATNFTRAFRRWTGTSPSEFRRRV